MGGHATHAAEVVTTPQVTTVKKGGSRIYVDDLTGERQPGVTSILNMMAKPGLRYWFAKMVAEEAVDSFSTIMDLVGKQRHDDAVDFLKRAPGRHSGRAADRGTIVHGLIERMNRGEELGNIHPDFEGYVRNYEDFLNKWQPEWLEVESTIWNSTVGFAGTCDGIARIQNEIALVDLKTGANVYGEVALQLSAYANGEFILEANGDRRPLPEIETAAVVHLREDRCEVRPIRLGADIFQVFVALREVFRWETDIKGTVLGKAVDPELGDD